MYGIIKCASGVNACGTLGTAEFGNMGHSSHAFNVNHGANIIDGTLSTVRPVKDKYVRGSRALAIFACSSGLFVTPSILSQAVEVLKPSNTSTSSSPPQEAPIASCSIHFASGYRVTELDAEQLILYQSGTPGPCHTSESLMVPFSLLSLHCSSLGPVSAVPDSGLSAVWNGSFPFARFAPSRRVR